MNAFHLAELRKELEPKGITVNLLPNSDHITYELTGPGGQAIMGRSADGQYYARWRKFGRIAQGGQLPVPYEQCLNSVLDEIA